MKIILAVVAALLAVCACTPSGAATPAAALTVPSVQIDSPANGHAMLIGGTLEVHTTGVDAQIGVARLELRVADGAVDSATTPESAPEPVFRAILRWLPTATGSALVSVVAYRPDGTASAPVSITINVVPPTPTPGPPTPSPTLGPSPSLTPVPTASPIPPASPTAEPPSPTPDPTPTTPPPTATPRVAAVDLMPRQCRSRDSLVRLTGNDLDGDGAADTVVYGNCGPDAQGEATFFGPVVRLSADDSVLGPRDGAILTGYGTPSDVVVVRPGPAAAFVVAHVPGPSPGVAQLTVYGLIPAQTVVDSVYELPASETWCSFEPLNDGLGGRVGIVVTEVEPGTYEFEETRCQDGVLHSFAYEWRVRDLPAPGQQWPDPARREL